MADIYLKVAILIIVLAVPIAIIGSSIYWNRMSTIPDSISHSSLMIVALTMAISINYYIAAIMFVFIISFVICFARNVLDITNDATSVFTSQIALSVSTLLIFLFSKVSNSASYFMAGSILLVNMYDIAIAGMLAILSVTYYAKFFDKLVVIVINRDIARAEGINIFLHDYIFLISVSFVVVVGVKLVGILLVAGLLIIPAMSARLAKVHGIGKSVVFSYLVIVIGGLMGLSLSFKYDLHTGPMISICVILLSICSYMFRSFISAFFNKI